jgi:hypothetical protein
MARTAVQIRPAGERLAPRHCRLGSYDERTLRRWLEARVQAIEAKAWGGIAEQLRFLGKWEFDGHHR